ncbi:hypothetical protein Trydic_g18901 [Trypoxylus dichotomus]
MKEAKLKFQLCTYVAKDGTPLEELLPGRVMKSSERTVMMMDPTETRVELRNRRSSDDDYHCQCRQTEEDKSRRKEKEKPI